jgi:hypothetical protein
MTAKPLIESCRVTSKSKYAWVLPALHLQANGYKHKASNRQARSSLLYGYPSGHSPAQTVYPGCLRQELLAVKPLLEPFLGSCEASSGHFGAQSLPRLNSETRPGLKT